MVGGRLGIYNELGINDDMETRIPVFSDSQILRFSDSQTLRFSSSQIFVILVILLHSRPLVVVSDSRPPTFSSPRILVILVLLSLSRIFRFSSSPLGFLSSRILVPRVVLLQSRRCPLPLFNLLRCHPPYQLHIQLSTAVQQV